MIADCPKCEGMLIEDTPGPRASDTATCERCSARFVLEWDGGYGDGTELRGEPVAEIETKSETASCPEVRPVDRGE